MACTMEGIFPASRDYFFYGEFNRKRDEGQTFKLLTNAAIEADSMTLDMELKKHCQMSMGDFLIERFSKRYPIHHFSKKISTETKELIGQPAYRIIKKLFCHIFRRMPVIFLSEAEICKVIMKNREITVQVIPESKLVDSAIEESLEKKIKDLIVTHNSLRNVVDCHLYFKPSYRIRQLFYYHAFALPAAEIDPLSANTSDSPHLEFKSSFLKFHTTLTSTNLFFDDRNLTPEEKNDII